MNYRLLFLISLTLFCESCTKQKVIDTGTSTARFDGSIMEYLRSDPFNWQLTVELIEHAGLTDLFDGRDAAYPEITFLGFTTQSVERFLYDSQYKDSSAGKFFSVRDVPAGMARDLVMKHVVPVRFTREDVNFKDRQLPVTDPMQPLVRFVTLFGNEIIAYREGSSYNGIPDAGPVFLRIYSIGAARSIPVASADIQPDNGVVHSLNYTYEFPEI